MRYLTILLLLFSTTAYAENTYKLQVTTKDFVPELGHDYQDAQYFTCSPSISVADCIASHQAEIEAEKAKRIAARVYEKQNPPAPIEPTKEELQATKASLLTQIAELDVKIAEVKPTKEVVAEEAVIK